MKTEPTVSFGNLALPKKGSVVVLLAEDGELPASAAALDTAATLRRALAIADFKGRFGAVVEILAPAGSDLDSIVAVGIGDPAKLDSFSWLKLGGVIAGHCRRPGYVGILIDVDGKAPSPEDAANVGAGILLRSYSFDKYKTKPDQKDKSKPGDRVKFALLVAKPAPAKSAFAEAQAVAAGVNLARDLVNEPANALGPVEFADRAEALQALGVKVEVLAEKQLRKLGMGALLGVAQGSVRPPRVVVMHWQGGAKGELPIAFIGKGVVFDTGGNSIKPAASMEDMRGDVGGAAAVVGAMHALAARKAKVNAIGIIGCVENMVDGNAQRPGDIVTSMSGQTIEVLNTDAEGRLVLADIMWYCQQQFRPQLMIDLATLTGAITVALGQHHAGLFSNDDDLAAKLTAAGLATHERVWRMPLAAEYDKLIDSKNADMKNIGGRYGGAITAAQFLQRFVKDTPWAHLDIAGMALGSPSSEINQSWASGFGVRLLDRFARDNFES